VVSFRHCFLLASIFAFALVARSAQPAGISGEWSFKVSAPDGDHDARLSITQDNGKITGTFAGEMGQFKVDGTVKGDDVQFTVRYTGDEAMDIPFEGKLHGDKMGGEYKAGDITGTWSAEKVR
jgi:hypothetical protein